MPIDDWSLVIFDIMSTNKQTFGARGEKIAAWYLAKKGYLILNRHYTSRFGEIDLVAKDGEQLVFVEVKTRHNHDCGLPEDSVNRTKLKKLKKAIYAYLSQNPTENYRLDVVAIESDKAQNKEIIRHHRAISDIFNI